MVSLNILYLLKNLIYPAIPIIFLVDYLKQKLEKTIEKMFQIIYNVQIEMNNTYANQTG